MKRIVDMIKKNKICKEEKRNYRQDYIIHKEEIRNYRQYYIIHREEIRNYRQYYIIHREEIRKYMQDERKRMREEILEIKKIQIILLEIISKKFN